jgi:DNA-directed RNA polymerase subunit RPC12/RpoP
MIRAGQALLSQILAMVNKVTFHSRYPIHHRTHSSNVRIYLYRRTLYGSLNTLRMKEISMNSEPMVIVSICLAIGGVVALIIALVYRCTACGSLGHGFNSDKQADFDTGGAYIVCRKCGDRQLKGKVESDGSVMWYAGGSGHFDKDGGYTGDAGGAFGSGGDGGGGDGGGA